MLHFLIGVAAAIFIGERLARWISPRTLGLLAGSAVLGAVVMGGGYLFLTGASQVPRPCETHAITYQELIDRGNSPELAEFKVRTGANVACYAVAPVSADGNGPDYDKDGVPTTDGLMRRMQRIAPTR